MRKALKIVILAVQISMNLHCSNDTNQAHQAIASTEKQPLCKLKQFQNNKPERYRVWRDKAGRIQSTSVEPTEYGFDISEEGEGTDKVKCGMPPWIPFRDAIDSYCSDPDRHPHFPCERVKAAFHKCKAHGKAVDGMSNCLINTSVEIRYTIDDADKGWLMILFRRNPEGWNIGDWWVTEGDI